MSRHFFDCQLKGKPVRVVLGYDRPLDGFYLQIECLTPAAKGAKQWPYLYASAADPDNCSEDLSYYHAKLRQFGIALPHSVLEALEQDAIDCAGNYVLEHLPDGTTRELLGCT